MNCPVQAGMPYNLSAKGLLTVILRTLLFMVLSPWLYACDKAGYDGPPYSAADVEFGNRIRGYVSADYSSRITDVNVSADKVTVRGNYTGESEFYVAEIPPYMDLLRLQEPLSEYYPESTESAVCNMTGCFRNGPSSRKPRMERTVWYRLPGTLTRCLLLYTVRRLS